MTSSKSLRGVLNTKADDDLHREQEVCGNGVDVATSNDVKSRIALSPSVAMRPPPRQTASSPKPALPSRRNLWAVGVPRERVGRRGVVRAMEPGSLASGARMAKRRQRAVSEGHGSAAARSASPRRQQQPPLKQRGRFQREGLAAERWPERTAGGGDLHERNTPRELAEHEDEGFSLPGRWVNSHELRAGDILIGRDGELQTVRKLEQHYDPEFAVSNLTIAKHHTFSVGPDAILVHNTSGSSVGDQFALGKNKTTAQMGEEIANQINKNRVTIRTAGGKRVDVDLRGKGHFDKSTGRVIETPHVHEAKVTKGPNGLENIDKKTKFTRPATPQDIRSVRRILERRGDL